MSKHGKITAIVTGVAYGSIDQQLSQRIKLTYGFGGLIIAVIAQIALAWWLIPNKALLNIFISPFQLIGILSMIYVVQGVTNYPFGEASFWYLKTEKYIPFFIRIRAFLYQPFVVVFIISTYLAVYMDYKTEHPHFYFWIIYNTIMLILAVICAKWLKIFLEKFENAIASIRYILPDENEFKNYERSIRNKIFNSKEIIFIFILFILIKLITVLYPDGTWKGGGGSGYVFPLTTLWTIFSVYLIGWGIIISACGSITHVYIGIFSALKNLRNQKLNIFLFHPDGCVGLGKIVDFIIFNISKMLIIISIITFFNFLAISLSLQTDPTDSWKYQMVGITIFLDSFALIIFLYPLREIRHIIKRKKEEERKLLLDRIKQKEEIYLKRNLESDELQEINNTLNIIKHIDTIPEWGISSRHWLSLLSKVLLTFSGVALQILIKYLNI